MNKEEVSKNKQFKIDILSSRALTQLFEAQNFKQIDFDSHMEDAATAALFARGDNMGITLAESPLMRRAMLQIKPRNVHDVAKCLAIIRPAAKKARSPAAKDAIIYDDDAITLIQKFARCDAEEADNLRRIITKTPKKDLQHLLAAEGIELTDAAQKAMDDLRKYSFCKSHAYSYAQLVWQLGYMKAHHPQQFWRAALRHCQSAYRKWVHVYEAKLAGVEINTSCSHGASIYANHRRQRLKAGSSIKERVKALGVWSDDDTDCEFYPDCALTTQVSGEIQIRGLIAYSRALSYGKNKTVLLLIGYAPHAYVEMKVSGKYIPVHSAIGITCRSAKRGFDGSLEADKCEFW